MISEAADLIVLGETIHSLDDESPAPEAFAVRQGRFAYVGSAAGAMALRGPATGVLDARKYTVLPGFVDAHLHLTSLGLKLDAVDLADVRSLEELVANAAAFARNSRDEWILGRGWDEHRWAGASVPAHDALSAAIPDRPVALTRVDGHAVLANACALQLAGLDDATADPPGGRLQRDAAGKLTGVLVDAAQAILCEKIPAPTHERLVEATRAAIAECNRWGITAVAEPGCGDDVLLAHRELIGRGEYSIRNHAMLHDQPALVAAHMRRGIVDGAHDGRLSVRSVKMYADGALGSRGAALLAPYSDEPANCGLILTPQSRIEEMTADALRHGFQVCVHAIGDRANRIVLNAFEAALRRAGGGDPRLRVEHAQVIALDDIPRFATLGIIASVQATHALSDLPWAQARLGPQRLRGAYAWRSLLDNGAFLANGTDAPVESASTPRTFFASISDPRRAMTRAEALASMTIWAARANFQDEVAGSITRGKHADFVLMDRDWLRIAPDEVERTEILATYFSGECVYGAV